MTTTDAAAAAIRDGRAVLGIELGSTRIKACLVLADDPSTVLAVGSHAWENRLVDRLWTYAIEDVWVGLQAAYADLVADVRRRHDVALESLSAIGVSAMMHGYLPFGADGELLTGFRTWRNTNTDRSAAVLSELFGVNIPLRWSIAHLYQAVLDEEAHVTDVAFFTTLAGYVHWKLTGRQVLGVGDASGMFPIDSATRDYDAGLLGKFDLLVSERAPGLRVAELLPEVLAAGEPAGELTPEGAALLDPSGALRSGVPLCPPEGDAGTGMVATCSVAPRTGNVSAGTSIFAMVVLERPLARVHHELDLVTTPAGDAVAMVHCNNGASELAAWVSSLRPASRAGHRRVSSTERRRRLRRHCSARLSTARRMPVGCWPTTTSPASRSRVSPRGVRCSCARPTAAFTLGELHALAALRRLRNARDSGCSVLDRRGRRTSTACSRTGACSARPGSPSASSPERWVLRSLSGRLASEGGAWGIAVLASYLAITPSPNSVWASTCDERRVRDGIASRSRSTPTLPTSPASPPTSIATVPASPSRPPQPPLSVPVAESRGARRSAHFFERFVSVLRSSLNDRI